MRPGVRRGFHALNRHERAELESLKFCCACSKKSTTWSYERIIKHTQKDCKHSDFDCPWECRPLGNYFIKQGDLFEHMKNCPVRLLTCRQCKAQVKSCD